ncbi:hypothetical protein B0H10DRAFT_891312 [Mycena sp. CBHHK59/15]|nr:hypothetical protein B0H10DRAFT_891312 [Mycena sp. CBHHK59/15]
MVCSPAYANHGESGSGSSHVNGCPSAPCASKHSWHIVNSHPVLSDLANRPCSPHLSQVRYDSSSASNTVPFRPKVHGMSPVTSIVHWV